MAVGECDRSCYIAINCACTYNLIEIKDFNKYATLEPMNQRAKLDNLHARRES
jgi:hypothetical protein